MLVSLAPLSPHPIPVPVQGKKKSILRKFLHHLRGSLQNMRMCMHDHRGWRWDNPCKRNIVTQLAGVQNAVMA